MDELAHEKRIVNGMLSVIASIAPDSDPRDIRTRLENAAAVPAPKSR
jgi:hypothetical protein